MDLHCHKMDVNTTFFNGDLDKDVFMEQPRSLENPARPNAVCKLQKALYGLKQAPRQWFAKIDSFLIVDRNFISSAYDTCLYIRRNKEGTVIISLFC